ncbi:MAG TPA: glycosyltransferase, partial [Bacteroidetes bacterium]|nr:glycosyltransferase [Bacteroidota bacterium]
LHGFDVFVLPSLWEGLPNVVLEAMATGLPVVATAVEGTVEAVVNGETGILVPSKQPEPLAEAILRIGRDADLRSRMGNASRRRVEENFSLDGQVRAFEELYSELAARA